MKGAPMKIIASAAVLAALGLPLGAMEQGGGADAGAAGGEQQTNLSQLFDQYDRNHDGKIDVNELAQITDWKTKNFLLDFDTDKNGEITKSEWMAGIQKPDFVSKLISRFDINNDGMLTNSEIAAIQDPTLRQALQRAEKNQESGLTKDELKAAFQPLPASGTQSGTEAAGASGSTSDDTSKPAGKGAGDMGQSGQQGASAQGSSSGSLGSSYPTTGPSSDDLSYPTTGPSSAPSANPSAGSSQGTSGQGWSSQSTVDSPSSTGTQSGAMDKSQQQDKDKDQNRADQP
jgi:Ca2+-binding EF-hand superfamily protein